MNYLAHIFLSGSNRRLQIGNFIGDFVKGRSYLNFPGDIQKGVVMHREIDRFTDNHPLFIDTLEILRPTFERYSGIIADMYFDYLLASEFRKYNPEQSLSSFARDFYFSAILNYYWLPRRVKGFIFHFIGSNRLKKYSTYEGLEESLYIMSVYKSKAIDSKLSITFLKENEDILRKKFDLFMPNVIDHVKGLKF